MVIAGASVPFTATATGWKNWRASSTPGARPDFPQAARTRRLESQPIRGKKGSSEITHEPESFGYRMLLKFVPNAEFLSARTAPVRYNRSRIPTCSSKYPPRVTDGAVVSPTVGTTAPLSAPVPATIFRPDARVCWNTFL